MLIDVLLIVRAQGSEGIARGLLEFISHVLIGTFYCLIVDVCKILCFYLPNIFYKWAYGISVKARSF